MSAESRDPGPAHSPGGGAVWIILLLLLGVAVLLGVGIEWVIIVGAFVLFVIDTIEEAEHERHCAHCEHMDRILF